MAAKKRLNQLNKFLNVPHWFVPAVEYCIGGYIAGQILRLGL